MFFEFYQFYLFTRLSFFDILILLELNYYSVKLGLGPALENASPFMRAGMR